MGRACAWFGGILLAFPPAFALAAPPNDHFVNAMVLTGVTNFATGSNAGATSEPGESKHANAPGGASVWWSWQAPFTGTVLISTAGSSFDTLLSVYTGHALSNLQTVAENDDAGGFGVVTSSLVFRAFAGETFHVAVDGFGGVTGTVQLAVARAGEPAPIWALPDLRGRTVHSSDFRNKVLVVDFWNTVCEPCMVEVPDLNQLYRTFSPEGLAFLGVALDADTVDVEQFASNHQIPYDIARTTPAIEMAFNGNVTIGPPLKFIIDRENRLVGSYAGGGDFAYYQKILQPLLRGSTQVPLNLRRQNAAFVLSWPATESGYLLEATTALGGTGWSAVNFPVVTTNDEHTVTLPPGAGDRFFRLRKPGAPDP